MSVRICYLAGPMRGIASFNFPAFDAAQAELEAAGWLVHSPAQMDRDLGFDECRNTLDGFDLKAAIRRDVDAILQSDAVIMLPGWEKSVGATAEAHLARWAGLEIILYPSMNTVYESRQSEI